MASGSMQRVLKKTVQEQVFYGAIHYHLKCGDAIMAYLLYLDLLNRPG